MQKTALLLTMVVMPVMALAQTPASKYKTVPVKAKTSMSASEAATAAAQAAAIAMAADRTPTATPAPVVKPVTAAVASPAASAAPSSAPAAHAQGAHETQELAIAARVHQGLLSCELGTNIRVEADPAQPGYFNLQGKGFRYRMHPVVTTSGAIRLEDPKAGAVWLQLANKSMLMDQKKGRRLADECAHPEQLAYAESMKTNPPPKLFDTTGMGR